MNDLFSEDPQFRRVQWTKISDNVTAWPQEIAMLVGERLPRDLGLTVQVVFQKVDDEKGYAVGTAIASNQSGASIGVPVVVKSWHVAPFDLFFREGRLYPLTDTSVGQVFFENGVGNQVAPQKPPPNMADEAQADARLPPMGGKYTYAFDTTMQQRLSGTLGAEDIAVFQQVVRGSPEVLAALEKRGNLDVLMKWATEKPAASPSQDKNDKERARGAMTVKKDSPNEYRIWTTPDRVFDPFLISVDRRTMRHMLDRRRAEIVNNPAGSDPLADVDRYGEVTLDPPKLPYEEAKTEAGGKDSLGTKRSPFVFDPQQHDRTVEVADKFGRYAVRDKDGVTARGYVIPDVVSFDGKKVSMKLFIGKTLAAIQGRIHGIPIGDDKSVVLEEDRPDAGKVGAMVYRDGDRVLATTPFQITNVTIYKGMRSLGIVDFKGEQANLIMSPSIDGIVPIAEKNSKLLGPLLGPKKNYFVSAKMFFVRLPRICELADSDSLKKTAMAQLDPVPLRVSQSNGLYVFRCAAPARLAKLANVDVPESAADAAQAARGTVEGPSKAQFFNTKGKSKAKVEESKVAFDLVALPRHEAAFLLAAMGVDGEARREVFKLAAEKKVAEVHFPAWPSEFARRGWRFDQASMDKTASEQALQRVAATLKRSMAEVVKCAAMLENAEEVDMVLSLGFVNPQNIQRFLAAQPMLEEVESMLAKLLLASRLGMKDIPEEAVRSAMTNVQQVTEGLGKLKMLQESNKTASARGGARPDGRPFGQAELDRAAGFPIERADIEKLAGVPLSWRALEKLAGLEGFAKWVGKLKPAEAKVVRARMDARNLDRYMKGGDVEKMVERARPANRILADKAVGHHRPLVDPNPHGMKPTRRPGGSAGGPGRPMVSTDFEFAGVPKNQLPPSLRARGAA